MQDRYMQLILARCLSTQEHFLLPAKKMPKLGPNYMCLKTDTTVTGEQLTTLNAGSTLSAIAKDSLCCPLTAVAMFLYGVNLAFSCPSVC